MADSTATLAALPAEATPLTPSQIQEAQQAYQELLSQAMQLPVPLEAFKGRVPLAVKNALAGYNAILKYEEQLKPLSPALLDIARQTPRVTAALQFAVIQVDTLERKEGGT